MSASVEQTVIHPSKGKALIYYFFFGRAAETLLGFPEGKTEPSIA